MKKTILFALCAMMTACAPKYRSLPMDKFENIISDPSVAVVDVRTPEEYMTGHINNAINIDWKSGHFAQDAAVLLPDKKQTIAVYCIHARRSKLAAQCLDSLGYTDVIELADGLDAWINAGKNIAYPSH